MKVSPAEWGERYEPLRRLYEPYKYRLEELVRDFLKEARIPVSQVEVRVKQVDSFVEKIERKGDRYADPLREMTDLIGIRVIAYYREDVDAIGEIVKREFDVDTKNSVMKGADFDPDRFGYSSAQYVVELGADRASLPEWRQISNLKFEIQVRTALQHAWAAIDHKLYYKSASQAPPEVRRRLYALSAVLELADGEFSNIRDAQAAITEKYADEVRGDKFNTPLDYPALAAYLDSHPYPETLRAMLIEQGNAMTPRGHGKRIESDRFSLSRVLEAYEIKSVAQFHTYLRSKIEPILRAVGVFEWTVGVRPSFEQFIEQALLIERAPDEKTFYSFSFTEPEWRSYQANLRKFQATERSFSY